MHPAFKLDEKLILVTGASSGIGRETCRVLDQLGARLVLAGRRKDALEETHATLSTSTNHIIAPFDLADTDGILAWVKSLNQNLERPFDGLVHAAGIADVTPLRMLRKAQIENVFSTNLYSTLGLLRAMSTRGIGADVASIVLISSSAALVGPAGMSVYASSKAALNTLARSAAKELGGKKIRVNCVAPGYVDTPMLQQAREGFPGDAFAKTVAEHFLGLISPEEVALAAAYLLSDAARRITGQTLVIDGGYSL